MKNSRGISVGIFLFFLMLRWITFEVLFLDLLLGASPQTPIYFLPLLQKVNKKI